MADAPRYVSLVPSLTETLFELGVGDHVVGATRFCVHPASGVEHVTRVGGTKDPRLERILGLDPSLVFVNQEENRLEDVQVLRDAGIGVHVTFPKRVADVAPMVRGVAAAVGRGERGEEIAAEVEAAEAEARAQVADRPPVPFAVLVWREPWIAAGASTFLSDILVTAGGVNVVEGGEDSLRYPEVTPEDLSALGPRRVLLPSEPFPFGIRHRDELVRRTRIGPSTFLRCDGELLTWHGFRTAAGLRAAARWLHGPESPPHAGT